MNSELEADSARIRESGVDASTGMRWAEASEKDVCCPNPECDGRFEINPWFYDTVAQCPVCNVDFIIRPPKAAESPLDKLPPGHPARRRRKAGVRSSAELPPALEMPDPPLMTRAKRETVRCPLCNRELPVTDKKEVECLACGCIFPADA